jgi:hypothetical protein
LPLKYQVLGAVLSASGSVAGGVAVARQTVGIANTSFDSASGGIFLHLAAVGIEEARSRRV